MSDKTTSYRIILPIEAYEALADLAKKQDRPMSNVIREALKNLLSEHGYDVSLDVDRGGYRHGAKSADQ